jgi:hypothetical protein
MKKSRLIALASVLMLGSSPSSFAAPIELVINGEFESPHFDGSWTTYSNAEVPGWSSTANILEFWVQGAFSSPVNGSDGLPTGQHYELTYYSPAEVTTQIMTVTGPNGTVDFSFDYWHRSGSGVQYTLTGSSSGTLVSGSYNYAPGSGDLNWAPISYTNLPVKAGETLTLSFNGIGGDTMGDHIDQVSVLYNAAAVPEPSTAMLMGLGGLGMAGMGYIKQRKSGDAV